MSLLNETKFEEWDKGLLSDFLYFIKRYHKEDLEKMYNEFDEAMRGN